jgi:hypothetical protein
MTELIAEAREYATQAHVQINHLRKYTKQPYQTHLKRVAQMVQEVCDCEHVIAAAWLHDCVEDTPATFDDIETKFGYQIRQYVYELTDISRPEDGSRKNRKAIDRDHLELASPEAQTIKLADLIDNCQDICPHDEKFGRLYVSEMMQLLEVLTKGDALLYRRAKKVATKWAEKWQISLPKEEPQAEFNFQNTPAAIFATAKFQQLFKDMVTAKDIAEALPSFDWNTPEKVIAGALKDHDTNVAGLRNDGFVFGYAYLAYMEDKPDPDCHKRRLLDNQLVDINAPLLKVISVLTNHQFCFVTCLGQVNGVITRNFLQKPIVRMWLFGLITLVEMFLADKIKQNWPNNEWTKLANPARLAKAQELKQERERRGQTCSLIDCLQLSDKAHVLFEQPSVMREQAYGSKREMRRVVAEFESLRNNLAHSQDIITHDWPQIIRIANRISEIAHQ